MRLNKKNRIVILEKLMERAFKTKAHDLEQTRKDFARRAYDETVNAQYKDVINVVGSFPIEWQRHTGGVIIKTLPNMRMVQRKTQILRHDDEVSSFRFRTRRNLIANYWEFGDKFRLIPVKANVDAYSSNFVYVDINGSDELVVRFHLIEDLCFDLVEEMATFETHCISILDAANTRAQLLSVWPEIADLVPEPEKKVKPLSLVDPAMVMTLNKLANLNTQEAGS